jgi:hypothetical protein
VWVHYGRAMRNGFTRRVPAHRARPGYDLASGLGVPAFGRLAFAIPPPGR